MVCGGQHLVVFVHMRRTSTQAEWTREDRDLLVELRTNMQSVRDDIAEARAEIKDINTGISARLLRLEGNAVSKIEIATFEDRLTILEAANNKGIGKRELIGWLISGAIGLISAIAAIIGTGKF